MPSHPSLGLSHHFRRLTNRSNLQLLSPPASAGGTDADRTGTLGGPLLPLGDSLLALTGVAIRRPAVWPPTVLSDHSILDVEVIDAAHRPVQIATTSETVLNISRARLFRRPDRMVTLLVDREAQGRLCTPFGRQC